MEGPAVSPAAIRLSSSSKNPIWTRLTISRPFGTQFVSRVLTQALKPGNILKQFTARLKSCPDTKQRVARTGIAVPCAAFGRRESHEEVRVDLGSLGVLSRASKAPNLC